MSYAGDVTCSECWSALSQDPDSQLVDVRTSAEWTFVGIPDLSGIDKKTHTIEWQSFPSMEVHPEFAQQVIGSIAASTSDKDCSIYMLCRSGARSIAAANVLTQAGFTKVYNVLDGFEGSLNEHGQRGTIGGWKASRLPWRQG